MWFRQSWWNAGLARPMRAELKLMGRKTLLYFLPLRPIMVFITIPLPRYDEAAAKFILGKGPLNLQRKAKKDRNSFSIVQPKLHRKIYHGFYDYTNLWGGEKTAKPEKSKKAYRKLARKISPCVNQMTRNPERKFKEINEVMKSWAIRRTVAKYDKIW